MRTTAAVFRAADAPFTIEPVEVDDPRPGEVLVRIAGVGLCHTDLLLKLGAPFPMPIVLGHEGSGIVETIGAGVTKVKPGDKVVLSYASCGGCLNCQQGVPQYCEQFYPLNFFGGRLDGSSALASPDGERIASAWFGQSSFAAHAIASERNVVKITADDVPIELLGPLGCGFQTGAGAVFNSLGARAGTSIAIFGVGAVGLAAVMAARVAGCTTIIGIDLHESRLALAKELGCTHTINAGTADTLAVIMEAAPGGVNYSFDTTGATPVMNQAVTALRPTGIACLVGAGGGPIELDAGGFLFGKTVKGVIEGDAVPDQFIPMLVELYRQGRFPIDRLCKTYRLDQINEAVHDSETGVTIKPIFIP